MRHGDKINNLGRKTAHRHAMLANMACSLIGNKRIFTTVAKAKALRTYVEPLLTKSKEDTTHSRRIVFAYLKNKEAVAELFKDVAVKIADRKGGYTRIIKTGNRIGDAAEMAMIELVDFNDIYTNNKSAGTEKKAKPTTRRSRSAGTKKAATAKGTDAAETAE
ncbi:MAG: 50S ribosomal protein L17 [Bacteroidota bacterium]|nr:50S ribosomal protein L17 [Bacteroidota bacterium]